VKEIEPAEPAKPAPAEESPKAAEAKPAEKMHDADFEGDCKEGHVEVMF